MIVKLVKNGCAGPGCQCPFYYHNDEYGIHRCKHPRLVKKNMRCSVDLPADNFSGEYQVRHPDCPIKRIIVENK